MANKEHLSMFSEGVEAWNVEHRKTLDGATADFRGADLTDAELGGVDFRGAYLTQPG